jgi:hypothetical protein
MTGLGAGRAGTGAAPGLPFVGAGLVALPRVGVGVAPGLPVVGLPLSFVAAPGFFPPASPGVAWFHAVLFEGVGALRTAV